MKLYRNAIILVVILSALIGSYAMIKNKKSDNTPPIDQPKAEKVLDYLSTDIVGVTLNQKDTKIIFERGAEDKWFFKQPSDLKLDTSVFSTLLYDYSAIYVEKVIEENASDLSKYGLANPDVVAEIKIADGTVRTIELGNLTATKEGYYLKEKGINKVYTVGKGQGDSYKINALDCVDKTLFQIEETDFTALAIEKKGTKVLSTIKKGEKDWELDFPVVESVEITKVEPIFTSIAAITMLEAIEEKPTDLQKYGLKDPEYAVSFSTADTKVKIYLGAEKEKGAEIYAKMEGSDRVFTLDISSLNFLDTNFQDLMEHFAYIVNITDVSKVVVQFDGKTIVSEIAANPPEKKDDDKFIIDGKDVSKVVDEKDNELFRKYYMGIIGVVMYDYDLKAKPTGTPEITFTFYLKGTPETTMKVEYVPRDYNTYYVFRNGVCSGMIVAKESFEGAEGVKPAYKKLMEYANK